MSDEEAFLAALKANPADDTTRLVYAAWLDEQGEPEKAEYLRLGTRLPRRGEGVDTESSEATRVNELGASLPTDWKEAAAGRFDLVLLNFTDKIDGIKRVRELFGIGLADAAGIVQSAPNRLLLRTPFDLAASYFTRLADGTGMTLAIRPFEHHGAPKAVVCQVLASCSRFDTIGRWQNYGIDPERDDEAIAALARLVATALEIGVDEARRRVTNPRFILAHELTFLAAKQRMEKYLQFCTREAYFATHCSVEANIHELP